MIKILSAACAAALVAGISMRASQAGTAGPAIYTRAQAAAGAKTYVAQCSKCHGVKLEGISAPALRGIGNGLNGESVSQAYAFISTQMPMGDPGSLTSTEYANVLAYILSRNGHAAGKLALSPAAAKNSTVKL